MNSAREASADDLQVVVELLNAAIAETPSDRAGHLYGFPRRFADSANRVRLAFESSDQAVLVGALDDVIVGFALCYIDQDLPGGPLAVIEELYVQPEAREVGVGESLINACVTWAREMNCVGIEADVQPGARSAKNLGERFGFTARSIRLHKRI